jgi:putative transposase
MDTEVGRHWRSIRLGEFDHTAAGAYFVTVVTQGKVCLLGDVDGETVRLSPVGQIVKKEWEELAERFPEIVLDEFVVMPNHVDGYL